MGAPAPGRAAPADWPARLARLFTDNPEHFTEFATLLLAEDCSSYGHPLRRQLRLVLDRFDAPGVPKWRGPKPDDSDTVIL